MIMAKLWDERKKVSEKTLEYQVNQPPSQNYAYQNPAYQQQVGGQRVYVIGAPQPQDVSRGRPAYYVNSPREPDPYIFMEDDDNFGESFNSIKMRNRFVQKVYTILTVQLFITFGFLMLVQFEGHVKKFIIANFLPIILISMVVYIGVALALLCSSNLRRTFPVNYILLLILTIAMALMTSVAVAVTPPIIFLAAVGTTALVCLVVSIFAIQTSWDVTTCGMCFCIATVVLVIYGFIISIMALCGVYIKVLHIIYSAVGCLLFTLWLMYDTQMIVGGRRIELSPEEYIVGALTLYIDIMIIFMDILSLFMHCIGSE